MAPTKKRPGADEYYEHNVPSNIIGQPKSSSTPYVPNREVYHDPNDCARDLYGGRDFDNASVTSQTINPYSARDDGAQRANKERIMHVEKSIVVDDETQGWRYATTSEVVSPGDMHIIPLIKQKWSHGVKAEKFNVNRNPGERSYDWTMYKEYIDTIISIQGSASQWQKALFMKTVVGEELHAEIINNNWLSSTPLESVMHYDLLKENITKHYKAFEDPMQATRQFMECRQKDSEKLTEFAVRLEKARIMCGIQSGDERMKVALLSGARSERMRREAEGPANAFSFIDLVNMGTRIENAEEREADRKKNTTSEVLALSPQPSTSQGFRGGNAQFQQGGRAQGMRGGYSGMQGQGRNFDNTTRPWQQTFGQNNWGNQNRSQNYGRPGRFNRGAFSNRARVDPAACKNCATTHEEGNCFAANTRCYACGRTGHLKRCCRVNEPKQLSTQTPQVTTPPEK